MAIGIEQQSHHVIPRFPLDCRHSVSICVEGHSGGGRTRTDYRFPAEVHLGRRGRAES